MNFIDREIELARLRSIRFQDGIESFFEIRRFSGSGGEYPPLKGENGNANR